MLKKITHRYKNLPVQLKASLWFLVCSFMQKGVSVLSTPIFTRLMSASEYGEYTVFNSWLTIISILVSLNLASGMFTSGLVKFQEEREIFSSSLQGLSLSLTLFWTIIYLLFRNYWNDLLKLTTVQMLCMLVMIWASAAFNLWSAEQRVEYRYVKLVAVTIIVTIAKPVIGVIFVVLSEDKVTARILGLALVELIGYIGLFFADVIRGKAFFSKKYWKYALFFNIPLLPHYLSQTVLSGADRIMIKRMVGASEAGVYGVAYSISQVMRLFNNALSNTISPWMYKKIREKQVDNIANISYTAILFVAIVNLLLIFFAPEVIRIFAPSTYYDAIWIIPPVSMSVYFIFMYDFFVRFEYYYEKTTFLLCASIAGAVLNIVLNLVFISLFGYLAAGYTTLICYMAYVIGHYLFMEKICKDEMPGAKIYSKKYLLLMSSIFLFAGFGVMATYRNWKVRYSLLIVLLILGALNWRNLSNAMLEVIHLKKKRED